MAGRWDVIETDEGPMRTYVSLPASTPAPGVIVAQHAGGVDEFVCGMSDRFAGAGFVAITPDLYHREEPDSKDDPMTRMSRLRDKNIIADVEAAVRHAHALPESRGQNLGITGFCMGGRVAYLMAAASNAFSASIVFLGREYHDAVGPGPGAVRPDREDQLPGARPVR
jgi:carboxymethylenebutenolidase